MGQNHCKGTKREKRTLQNILLTRVHNVSYVLFRQFFSSFFWCVSFLVSSSVVFSILCVGKVFSLFIFFCLFWSRVCLCTLSLKFFHHSIDCWRYFSVVNAVSRARFEIGFHIAFVAIVTTIQFSTEC